MRTVWLVWCLVAASGGVLAADLLCAGPEPLDVACDIFHARNPETAADIRYEWREAGLPADTFCGVREPRPAWRAGRPALRAATRWNPYQFSGRCYPSAGETRIYRVRACSVESGLCSANWSNPVTVIGVASSSVRCCTSTACGDCP